MQLQGRLESYKAAGLNVVALTYDAPPLQQAFIDKFAIAYPVLSDIDAASVKQLGILNTDYKPGDDAYGIPYPGVFIVRPDGRIAGKVFLDGYATRVSAERVLAYAQRVLAHE